MVNVWSTEAKAKDLSDCVMHIFIRDSGVGMSIAEQKKYVSFLYYLIFSNILVIEYFKIVPVLLRMAV